MLTNTITSLDALPPPPAKRPRSERSLMPLSRYDAARTTDENRMHWRFADGASANAANSAEVRRVLRNRARYEDDNNSYVNGLTGDRANETIGTGPRLQLRFPETFEDPDFQRAVAVEEDLAHQVELKWKEHCQAIGLLDKLLVTDESETREGEIFGFKFINPELPRDTPQLDLRLYEADQIDTPDWDGSNPNSVPGIVFDQFGNPAAYHVLKRHPGEVTTWGTSPMLEYDVVPARQMIHFFKPRRAGQARGIPAFTSSLGNMGILRRYTVASLLTAEAQSRINAVIEQENALAECDDEDEEGVDPAGQQIKFAGTHMLTLTAGQTAKILPHSTPAPNYGEFKGEVLTEGGRPINAPGNVSRGTSKDMNYSSGRLDQQWWQRAIRIRRRRFERIVLDALFGEWLRLALLIPGYLPSGLPPLRFWKWKWRWDGFVSIDPVKDASAATERLENGTSNLDRECGELGEDWEEVQDQRLVEEAREIRRRAKLGLPPKQPRPAKVPAGRPAEEEDDDE